MAKQPRPLVGRTAAITGAARGIGRATAQALLREGMKVAIGDLDLATAEQTARDLGPGALALPLNVTDRSSFASFLDETETQLGPIDVLINNAGIMAVGRFIDEDDLTAARQIDINLGGVILGMKLALERMIPRRRGHIVNISSQAGKFGAPGGATYSATKHAVVGLTEAVRGELRLMGIPEIDVSYVMPVVVNTELGSGLVRARGIKNLEASDVADAIVEALQLGIVDVWVPKRTKSINRLGVVLPRRAAEGIARALKADRVLMGADAGIRRGYELRAANSRPGLEPDAAPAELPAAADTTEVPA
jgi:NAD(P)-dependent dehydrogenase (short-subunit alcohol dehydrogenase family)